MLEYGDCTLAGWVLSLTIGPFLSIIWPSRYDGAPIVVIANYTLGNRKTGGVVQTYILREDIDPRDASKNGADASICGTCPHRGEVTTDPARKIAKGRTCYVNLGQGVLITWRAYHRNAYPDAMRARLRAAIGAGRVVRIRDGLLLS